MTVRRGGHIEPEDIVYELPLAAKAALEAGTEILFLTTDITDASPEADRTLGTACQLGITHFKLGYYRYTEFGSLARQLTEIRRRIADVVKLARKHSILPCVHVHSGKFLPSHGTQLYDLIRDFSPDDVGAYVDTLHMALEGGDDGWRQGLDLLAPWIALAAVKNFAWQRGDGTSTGSSAGIIASFPLPTASRPCPSSLPP